MSPWLVLLLIAFALGQEILLKRDNTSNRFTNIFYPLSNGDNFNSDVYGYDYVIVPVLKTPIGLPEDDLCAKTESYLNSTFPGYVGDSATSKMCHNYFCGVSRPYFLNLGMNETNPLNERLSNLNHHIAMHMYCTQCAQTKLENFTNENCTWFVKEQDYCLSSCSVNNTCLYHQHQKPLCYHWDDNKFYRSYFLGQTEIYWVYYLATPIFFLVESIFGIVYAWLFLVLPGIKELTFSMKKVKTSGIWDKIRTFYSLRIQSIVLLFISFHIEFLACLVDVCQLAIVRVYVIAVFIRASFILIVVGNVITLWKHICDMADDGRFAENPKLSVRNMVGLIMYYIVFICFAILGIVSYGGYTFIDKTERVVFVYMIGGWIWLILIAAIICVVVLNIYSIRIWILYAPNSANILKIKFTRLVLFLSFVLISVLIILALSGIQFTAGRDIFSIFGYMLMPMFHCLCCGGMSWLMMIGITDTRILTNFYMRREVR